MCMRSGIPLIESGTMGYNGQTYPIIKGETECYHCQPKPPDKQTFAVCTIHARPTTMVHCVHYAKELYEALFGESSLQDGSSSEFAQIKGYLSSSTPNGAKDDQSLAERCQQVLVSLFVKKIMELLEMKSAWPSSPPVPLEEARIRSLKAVGNEETERWLADHETTSFTTDENIQLCLCAMMTLMKRDPAPFRKEDTQSVLFVSCIANLRAEVFHLTNQPFEEIRSIAGSIVPAIATTNAMVAAGVVHELESVLRRNIDLASPRDWKTIYVRKTPQVRKRKGGNAATPFHSSAGLNLRRINELYLIHTAPTATPNASCRVCQSVVPTVTVCLGTPYHTITLGDFARSFVEEKLNLESPSMSRKNAIVFETEDYEELEGELLSKIMEGDTTEKEFLVSGVNREAEWIVKVEFSDRDGFEIKGLEEAEKTEARASGLQQNLTPRTTEPPTTEVVVIEDGEAKEDDVIEID
ncbi:ubiquitin-like 1-activating enzyme E1 B [Angomonas deanei]|uniref:ThiF family, putative n=1 Tax=Angomonas deanei TaxID=59799 RepID=A0A7G2CAY9_9TRYP|nr:ubiquitin-like 1-activating enzyme E1 B [Angomonas deanei]CAD2217030.1 ThiF family, putative [Angomonas deanei]|eukprot:EPY33947.1 ubiquitin-like 1-activating enzyme E1 B [Angomonas deanei]